MTLVHTKSGVFLGIGLIFMLYTVLMLVNNIEETFNEIWQVNSSRSIYRSFTNYLAAFFLFPIFIVVTTGLSIVMTTIASSMPDVLMLGTVVGCAGRADSLKLGSTIRTMNMVLVRLTSTADSWTCWGWMV